MFIEQKPMDVTNSDEISWGLATRTIEILLVSIGAKLQVRVMLGTMKIRVPESEIAFAEFWFGLWETRVRLMRIWALHSRSTQANSHSYDAYLLVVRSSQLSVTASYECGSPASILSNQIWSANMYWGIRVFFSSVTFRRVKWWLKVRNFFE